MNRARALRCLAGVLVAAGLAACTPAGEKTGVGTPALVGTLNPADFRTALNNQELMGHVIDAAADGVWLHQGWVDSASGTEELFPTTDEGWLATENAAATLAEASNLLLLPGRPMDDDPAWVTYVHMLHDAAMKARQAAEVRDKEAFFNAGGDIYVACRSCHEQYVIGTVSSASDNSAKTGQ